MSHLSDEQLSALADDALPGAARVAAEQHLEACPACREALAGLVARDDTLRTALEHDPGEAYFGTFAARVGGRLRAASLSGAQARERSEGRGLASWFHVPRKVALVATVAAVVGGAGIVMLTSREVRVPGLREREIAERAAQEAPPAPPLERLQHGPNAPGAAASRAQAQVRAGREAASQGRHVPATEAPVRRGAPPAETAAPKGAPARGTGAGVPLSRAYEVRRNAAGEDVAVHPPGEFVFRPPAGPPRAPAKPGEPVYAEKQRYAVPLQSEKRAPGLRGGVRPAPADEGSPVGSASAERSGAVPSAPAPPLEEKVTARSEEAASPSLAAEAREVSGPRDRVCGTVRDDAGRPVAGAQVVNRATGANVTTAGDGSFCLEARGREQEITVMAVGYKPAWLTAVAGEPARVVLRAVPVLGWAQRDEAAKPSGRAQALAPREARGDAYDELPTLPRALAQNAQRLTVLAEQVGSAGAWESAAAEWERAIEGVRGGPLESPTRFQATRAWVKAWQVGRTGKRTARALANLGAYLARAPQGAERDTAQAWLRMLRK